MATSRLFRAGASAARAAIRDRLAAGQDDRIEPVEYEPAYSAGWESVRQRTWLAPEILEPVIAAGSRATARGLRDFVLPALRRQGERSRAGLRGLDLAPSCGTYMREEDWR